MRRKLNHVLLVGRRGWGGIRKGKWIKKAGVTTACVMLHFSVFCQKDTTTRSGKVYYGVASFYSKHLEGAVTATGEIFHHNQMVAASNNFKLNSWVRITNMRNGKSVIVRINDRMGKAMQALGRIADVTISAAQELGFINRGLARVKVEEVAQGTTE